MRCPFLYLEEKEAVSKEYQPFVRLDNEITLLAAEKLGISSFFLGQKSDAPEKALAALDRYDWLVKARFEYGDLRVKVPFLHRVEGGWEIYFLFVGLFPHNDDMTFYAETVWVLEHNGLVIRNMKMIHLNAEYVRGKELDVQKLFIVTDSFYNKNNHPCIQIQKAVRQYKTDIARVLQDMKECTREKLGNPVRSPKCSAHKKCKYYTTCFRQETELPYNSIMTLTSSQHKYAMQKEGIVYLRDARIEEIEGSRMQYAEIMADRNGGFFADRVGLRSWLSRISYPITFLDFEWERFAIPPYEGMKPYDVLPFEYSVHVMQEDGSITHSVFLSVHDDREDMIRGLIRDVCETGTVLAYNAEGAEKIRLREMMQQFPQYAEQLQSIHARMEDLQVPFVSGTVYDTRMEGQWSLKKIMSLMQDKSYKDLDINQGMDAVFEWRHLDYGDDVENRQEIIENLKKYCGMDSYSMTVVYKWLVRMAETEQ